MFEFGQNLSLGPAFILKLLILIADWTGLNDIVDI